MRMPYANGLRRRLLSFAIVVEREHPRIRPYYQKTALNCYCGDAGADMRMSVVCCIRLT